MLDTTPGRFIDTFGQGILPIELATKAEAAANEAEARSSASSVDLSSENRPSTESSRSRSSLASNMAAQVPYPPRRKDKPPKDSFIYCSDVHCELLFTNMNNVPEDA